MESAFTCPGVGGGGMVFLGSLGYINVMRALGVLMLETVRINRFKLIVIICTYSHIGGVNV